MREDDLDVFGFGALLVAVLREDLPRIAPHVTAATVTYPRTRRDLAAYQTWPSCIPDVT